MNLSVPPTVPTPQTLDHLPLGVVATIVDLARAPDPAGSETLLRLMEIGFVPGERLRIVAAGFPGREPLAVRLGHTTFALRLAEAALIQVEPDTAQGGTAPQREAHA